MSRTFFTRLTMAVVAAVFVTTLTACETTKGAGQDLENAGDKIEDAVD